MSNINSRYQELVKYNQKLIELNEGFNNLKYENPHSHKTPVTYGDNQNTEKRLKDLQEQNEALVVQKKLRSAVRSGMALPMFEEDEAIRIYKGPGGSVPETVAPMFYVYMKPFLKREDAEDIYTTLQARNVHIIPELVYNWNTYKDSFKLLSRQYMSKDVIISKIENITLPKVKLYDKVQDVNIVNPMAPTVINDPATALNDGISIDATNRAIEEAVLSKADVAQNNEREVDEYKQKIQLEFFKYMGDEYREFNNHVDEYHYMIAMIKTIFGQYDLERIGNNSINYINYGVIKSSILNTFDINYLKNFYMFMQEKYSSGNSGYEKDQLIKIASLSSWLHIPGFSLGGSDKESVRHTMIRAFLYIYPAYTMGDKGKNGFWFKQDLATSFNAMINDNYANIKKAFKNPKGFGNYDKLNATQNFYKVIDQLPAMIYGYPDIRYPGVPNITLYQILSTLIDDPDLGTKIKGMKYHAVYKPGSLMTAIVTGTDTASVNTEPEAEVIEPPGEKMDPGETVTGEGFNSRSGERKLNSKYFINMDHLDKGILAVRYNKNRHLTNIKHQVVGGALKKTIKDVVSVGKLDLGDYHKLLVQEKDILHRFLALINKSDLVRNENELEKEWEHLLGEYNAGNTNPIIKQKMKILINHYMVLGVVPRQTGQMMLAELMA